MWSPKVLRNFSVQGAMVYPLCDRQLTLLQPACLLSGHHGFSCQEHSFSDKTQKQTLFDATSHEAWTSDMQWIYIGFTVFCSYSYSRNLSCWKRRHSGTWHWELRAEQRDSKIQGYSSSHFRILIFEDLHRYSAAYCMIFMTDVLNTQVCATRAVCILVPEWSLQWYVIIQETDFCFPESYLYKTIKPSVQLEPLPVYCFLVSLGGCCVALRSIARLFQVALVLSTATGLLHLDIHVFLETRLVTLNIWSPEPFGCVIQRFALHLMQLRHEPKDFWTLSVSGFVWFWTDDLFPGVDWVAPVLCVTLPRTLSRQWLLPPWAIVWPVVGSIHVLPVNYEAGSIITFLGFSMRGQEQAACF